MKNNNNQLQKHIIVNATDSEGRTALHLAMINFDLSKSKELLKNGFDLNIKDNSGKTAYDYLLEASPVAVEFLRSFGNLQRINQLFDNNIHEMIDHLQRHIHNEHETKKLGEKLKISIQDARYFFYAFDDAAKTANPHYNADQTIENYYRGKQSAAGKVDLLMKALRYPHMLKFLLDKNWQEFNYSGPESILIPVIDHAIKENKLDCAEILIEKWTKVSHKNWPMPDLKSISLFPEHHAKDRLIWTVKYYKQSKPQPLKLEIKDNSDVDADEMQDSPNNIEGSINDYKVKKLTEDQETSSSDWLPVFDLHRMEESFSSYQIPEGFINPIIGPKPEGYSIAWI